MTYNLTALASNSTGLLSFAQNLNTILMFGLLGTMFLLSFSVIVFISFIFTTGDAQKALLGTSWIAFTLAIFLLAMSLIPLWVFILTLVAAGGSLAFSYLDK